MTREEIEATRCRQRCRDAWERYLKKHLYSETKRRLLLSHCKYNNTLPPKE